ncbi:hypothetical protein CHU93_05155 [Sandarakinorhabdus cyanobacteriorum]|uniref:SMODS and SLOG-associating 2TM effector domain-containing protein n=1 Tax=Sandarakinorhabdus cyanobacteriorum TaxID=1981098 RepID=A0A255YQZ2_9SPHN|nr:hypothetical protein [Sandarakinorhabdus cyanobacteriorum]OYQ31124.1 hypothetical protein CHU93_05155 [Sandarakinorhabdus cyanobacteriorum]
MDAQAIDIAFRVGVTGSTRVVDDPASDLGRQLHAALLCIRQHMIDCAGEAALRAIRSAAPTRLHIVSPLAEGADRLVARVALALDGTQPQPDCRVRLEAPLPFAQAEYEQSFVQSDDPSGSIEAFRALLAQATAVQILDGERQPDRVRHNSYRAVGRTVVRNCDLLIVVEDPAQLVKGPGGTSEIAAYAEQMGVPKLVFDGLGRAPPRWISSGNGAQMPGDACQAAGAYVRQTLMPPPAHQDRTSLLHRVRGWFGVVHDPVQMFLRENHLHNFNIWRVRDAALGATMRFAKCEFEETAHASDGNHWLLHSYRRHRPDRPSSSIAAQLATKYQQRYRSSYLVVLASAALALAIAGFAVGGLAPKPLQAIELALLAVIALLWGFNEIMEWHQRYIAYRFLAELERFTKVLMSVGRTAPHGRLDQAVTGPYRWVVWYYQAQTRSRGISPMIANAGSKAHIKEQLETLVSQQIRFHTRRSKQCKGMHEFLGRWAIRLFIVTFVCVALKVSILPLIPDKSLVKSIGSALAVLALLCPIFGVTIFGLRAYEEFELLENQSNWLMRELASIQGRIQEIQSETPLALQQLGTETTKLVQLLLHDVSGWAQTFTVKAIEG